MASKSGGWKPPSGDQHPPFSGGQKGSKIGGAHCAGPMSNHGGGGEGANMANAVVRPPNGIRTK